MLRRMWRAFWMAMREPVKQYAPDRTLTLRVDVDSEDALARLSAIADKAAKIRADAERAVH